MPTTLSPGFSPEVIPSNFPRGVSVCLGRCNRCHLQLMVTSHSSGHRKSKFKVSAELVSPEASLLDLQMVIFISFPLIQICVLIFSSHKDTSHPGSGPSDLTVT